jgi:hypothetical protein
MANTRKVELTGSELDLIAGALSYLIKTSGSSVDFDQLRLEQAETLRRLFEREAGLSTRS